MRSFIFNGYDFGELTRAKVISEAPLYVKPETNQITDGGVYVGNANMPPKVMRLKVFLEPKMKASPEALVAQRRKLDATLLATTPTDLQYQDNYTYRKALCTDASTWDSLLQAGSCELEFTVYEAVVYGDVRESAAATIDVKGTAETYPTFELAATEGDSVMALSLDKQMFVNVIGTFTGGEKVVIDCESETVAIDGADACKDVGFYSDFFSLVAGVNKLAFAGCSAHVTRYQERWL